MGTCTVKKIPISRSQCALLPSLAAGMLTLPPDFTATEANVVDPTFWQNLLGVLGNTRITLWPDFFNFENKSEEAVYAQNALSTKNVRPGRYQFMPYISKDLCTHKAIHSHAAGSGQIAIIDVEDNLWLWLSPDDGLYRGLTLQMLNPEKLKLNDGSNPTTTPIYIVLANSNQLDKHGVIIDGGFVSTLIPLSEAKMEQVTAAAMTIVLDLMADCDNTPIQGLLAADFKFTTAAGANVVIATATESSTIPGRYTITTVGAFVTLGSVFLRAPNLLTTELYEADPLVVTF